MATIEILNWDKYQTRRDIKASSWFRLEHRIFFDPDWSHFEGEEVAVWVYLLALASLKNRGTFQFLPDVLLKGVRVSKKSFDSALEKLEQMHCVHVDVTDTSRGRNANVALQTDRQTDILAVLDFEKVYAEYPKRRGDQGKKKGLEFCRKNFTTQEQYDSLLGAVRKYALHCLRTQKAGTEFVKKFITFVRSGEWEEWKPAAPTTPGEVVRSDVKSFDDLGDYNATA